MWQQIFIIIYYCNYYTIIYIYIYKKIILLCRWSLSNTFVIKRKIIFYFVFLCKTRRIENSVIIYLYKVFFGKYKLKRLFPLRKNSKLPRQVGIFFLSGAKRRQQKYIPTTHVLDVLSIIKNLIYINISLNPLPYSPKTNRCFYVL